MHLLLRVSGVPAVTSKSVPPPGLSTVGRLAAGSACAFRPSARIAPVSRSRRLEFVPDDEWKSLMMLQWQGDAIEELLDDAQEMLEATAAKLRVPVQVRGVRGDGCQAQGPRSGEVVPG